MSRYPQKNTRKDPSSQSQAPKYNKYGKAGGQSSGYNKKKGAQARDDDYSSYNSSQYQDTYDYNGGGGNKQDSAKKGTPKKNTSNAPAANYHYKNNNNYYAKDGGGYNNFEKDNGERKYGKKYYEEEEEYASRPRGQYANSKKGDYYYDEEYDEDYYDEYYEYDDYNDYDNYDEDDNYYEVEGEEEKSSNYKKNGTSKGAAGYRDESKYYGRGSNQGGNGHQGNAKRNYNHNYKNHNHDDRRKKGGGGGGGGGANKQGGYKGKSENLPEWAKDTGPADQFAAFEFRTLKEKHEKKAFEGEKKFEDVDKNALQKNGKVREKEKNEPAEKAEIEPCRPEPGVTVAPGDTKVKEYFSNIDKLMEEKLKIADKDKKEDEKQIDDDSFDFPQSLGKLEDQEDVPFPNDEETKDESPPVWENSDPLEIKDFTINCPDWGTTLPQDKIALRNTPDAFNFASNSKSNLNFNNKNTSTIYNNNIIINQINYIKNNNNEINSRAVNVQAAPGRQLANTLAPGDAGYKNDFGPVSSEGRGQKSLASQIIQKYHSMLKKFFINNCILPRALQQSLDPSLLSNICSDMDIKNLDEFYNFSPFVFPQKLESNRNPYFSFFTVFLTNLNIQDDIWFYLDNEDKTRGPFPSSDMDVWNYENYFQKTLKIAWKQSVSFITIEEFIRDPLLLIKTALGVGTDVRKLLKITGIQPSQSFIMPQGVLAGGSYGGLPQIVTPSGTVPLINRGAPITSANESQQGLIKSMAGQSGGSAAFSKSQSQGASMTKQKQAQGQAYFSQKNYLNKGAPEMFQNISRDQKLMIQQQQQQAYPAAQGQALSLSQQAQQTQQGQQNYQFLQQQRTIGGSGIYPQSSYSQGKSLNINQQPFQSTQSQGGAYFPGSSNVAMNQQGFSTVNPSMLVNQAPAGVAGFPGFVNKVSSDFVGYSRQREDDEFVYEDDEWSRYVYDYSSGMFNNNPANMEYADDFVYGKKMR